MKMKRKTALYLSLIIYFVMFVLYSQNTYLLTRPYSVEVIQKYSGVGGGKYSKLEFIVVYKTKDGIVFDRNESASEYSQLSVGDQVIKELRPFDVNSTFWKNVFCFFFYLLAMSAGFAVGTTFLLAALSGHIHKWFGLN